MNCGRRNVVEVPRAVLSLAFRTSGRPGIVQAVAAREHVTSWPAPAVAEMANDDRLLRIARRALGVEAVPYRATLFEKPGRANWLVV